LIAIATKRGRKQRTIQRRRRHRRITFAAIRNVGVSLQLQTINIMYIIAGQIMRGIDGTTPSRFKQKCGRKLKDEFERF